MALPLKELFYGVGFKVDDKGIKKADSEMTGFKRTISNTSKEIVAFGKQSIGTGNIISSTIGALGTYIGLREGVGLVKELISESSDLAETMSFFHVVFPTLGDEVEDWSNRTADALNRGRISFIESLTSTQDLLTGYGATEKQAAELSKTVLQLVTDLSSAKNISQDRAFENFTSGLLGQHRAFKMLGIAVNETTLKNKAHQMGINENFDSLDEFTKVYLRLAVAVDQSQNSIGDAARTADSFANVAQGVDGQIRDLKADLGDDLKPVVLDFLIAIRDSIPEIKEMAGAFIEFGKEAIPLLTDFFKWFVENRKEIGKVGGGAIGIMLLAKAIGKVVAIAGIAGGAIGTVGFAIQAVAGGAATVGEGVAYVAGGPVTLLIGAIVAIILAIIQLHKKFGSFTEMAKQETKAWGDAIDAFIIQPWEDFLALVKGAGKLLLGEDIVNSMTTDKSTNYSEDAKAWAKSFQTGEKTISGASNSTSQTYAPSLNLNIYDATDPYKVGQIVRGEIELVFEQQAKAMGLKGKAVPQIE